MNERQSPAAGGTADPGISETRQPKCSATPRKWQRVLRAFADGKTLNRFEAARELRDWCLNTTVSQLEARGVTILRHDETVPGAYGDVHCCRYSIAPESLQCALEILSAPKAPISSVESIGGAPICQPG